MLRVIENENGTLSLNFPKTVKRTDTVLRYNICDKAEWKAYYEKLAELKAANIKHMILDMTGCPTTEHIMVIKY